MTQSRQDRHKARQKAAGYIRVELSLPAALVARVDELRGDDSRSEYVERVLVQLVGKELRPNP